MALSQGAKYSDYTIDSNGHPLAGVQVRVCATTSPSTPPPTSACTPLATLYTDETLVLPSANPVISDAAGNFSFFAPTGFYILQFYQNGTQTFAQTVQVGTTTTNTVFNATVGFQIGGSFGLGGQCITSTGTGSVWGACGGGGGGSGTVTNVSSTSTLLTIANPTTTPAITPIVLGTGTKLATTSATAPAASKCVEMDTAGNLVIAGSNSICGSVNSITGDGTLFNNSASVGAVTLTLANVAAHKYWGNNTAVPALPGYLSIANADLPGAGAITIGTTAPLAGGASVALGGSLALTCTGCLTSVTAHNLLSATHGDTTTHTVVRGDLIAGIGAVPSWTAVAKGGTNTYPKWNSSGDVIASTLAASGVGSPLACSNQFVTGFTLSADAVPTSACTTATLASAQFANQGTATTVLHGNAAGNPSFAAVTSADTTGTFPANAHNLLSATHGDTTAGTVAVGDLITGQTGPTWARLAANATATKKYLQSVSSGAASWQQVAYGDLSGTPTLFYQTVQDEGSNLPQEPIINFTGTGVTCTDNSSVGTNCNITSGGGGTVAGATLFATTTLAGPSNTATETSLLSGTGISGSKTIAANTFANGTVTEVELSGFYSTPAVTVDNLTLRVKCGSTVLASKVVSGLVVAATNQAARLYFYIHAIGTGASGSLLVNTIAEFTGTTLTPSEASIVNTSAVAYDFTTSCAFDVTAQWAAAQAGESVSVVGAAWIPGAPVTSVNGSIGAVSVGTVTSIATTSPITGGTINTSGTIACPTCGVTGTGLQQFASTTSLQLAGVISDETGSGALAFATSPTLVTPRVTTINDANGNPFLTSSATASAVDSLTVTNAATANPATVTLGASGSDANINLKLQSKGTGGLIFGGITGLTQCLHVDTNGLLSGTGADCGAGSGGASTADSFVTIAHDADLTGERTLTGTTGDITITDGGVNSSVTLDTGTNIPKLASANNFIGVNTIYSLNGVIDANSSACTGADIGAKVNACGADFTTVYIPAGSYTKSTEIVMSGTARHLVGVPEATIINFDATKQSIIDAMDAATGWAGTGITVASKTYLLVPRPSAPILTVSNTGGSLTNASALTLTVWLTFTSANGEGYPGTPASIVLNSNGCNAASTTCSVTVTAPTLPTSVTSYSVYDGPTTTLSAAKRQAASANCTNITGSCVVQVLAAGAVPPTMDEANVPTVDIPSPMQGTGLLAATIDATGNRKLTKTIASTDFTAQTKIGVWVSVRTTAAPQTAIQFFASDGTNTNTWSVTPASTYDSWQFLELDRASGTGSANMAAITSVGFQGLVANLTYYFDAIYLYTPVGNGITMSGCTSCTIENIKINWMVPGSNPPINITGGSKGADILNVHTIGGHFGIYVDGSANNISIVGGEMEQANVGAIRLNDGTYGDTIDNAYIHDNVVGVYIRSTAYENRVLNLRAFNNNQQHVLTQGDKTNIIGGTYNQCTNFGISLNGGTNSVVSSTVIDSLIGASAIQVLNGGINHSLTGNIIKQSGGSGIDIDGTLGQIDGGAITGNVINFTGISGWQGGAVAEGRGLVLNNVQDINVTGNQIDNAGQSGPLTANVEGVIINNSAARNTLEGNTVRRAVDEGIAIYTASANLVHDNIIYQNGVVGSRFGLRLDATATTTDLCGNLISGNGSGAISDNNNASTRYTCLSSTGQAVGENQSATIFIGTENDFKPIGNTTPIIRLYDTTPAQATPSKYLIAGGGELRVANDGLSVNILRLTDPGDLFITRKFTPGAATTAAASINIPSGTAPTTPVAGDIWRDANGFLFVDATSTQGSVCPYNSAGTFSNCLTSAPTANRTTTFPDNTGTVAEGNIDNAFTATQTFNQPANKAGQASIVAASAAINTTETIIVKTPALTASRLVAGTVLRMVLVGTCTSTVANVSTIALRYGTLGTTGDALLATGTVTAAASGTTVPFKIIIDLTVRTTGASATGFATYEIDNNGTTGIAAVNTTLVNPTMSAFNTTTANAIISVTYKTAATTTTSTFQQAWIEVVYQ